MTKPNETDRLLELDRLIASTSDPIATDALYKERDKLVATKLYLPAERTQRNVLAHERDYYKERYNEKLLEAEKWLLQRNDLLQQRDRLLAALIEIELLLDLGNRDESHIDDALGIARTAIARTRKGG